MLVVAHPNLVVLKRSHESFADRIIRGLPGATHTDFDRSLEVTPPGAGHLIGEIFARKVSDVRQADPRTRSDRTMDRAA
jgi:hypothetical protein